MFRKVRRSSREHTSELALAATLNNFATAEVTFKGNWRRFWPPPGVEG